MTDIAAIRARSLSQRRSPAARVLLVLVVACLAVVGAIPRSDAGSSWTAPLQPLEVVRGFDPPAGPYAPGHRGVDLAGHPDQPIRSAADGVVTFAGTVGGIGVVVVGHGRIRTTYQPVREFRVPVGDVVGLGEWIGLLSAVGSHCAPVVCLHWGAVAGEEYLDPLTLLDPGPSRLLPYWDDGDRLAAPAGGDASGLGWVATEASVGSGLPDAPHDVARTGQTLGAPLTVPAEYEAAATGDLATGAATAGAVDDRRPLPAGVAAAVAVIGGLVAAAAFLAIRRRRG